MLRTIEQSKDVDAEARLLARVYALILTWRDDDQAHEPRDTDAGRAKTGAEREGNDVEQ
jgi:hypothetical protein